MSQWQTYNPNPVSRSVGDCAVRAVAKALDMTWERAYAMIAMNGFLMGDVMTSNGVWGATLRQNGFTRNTVPNTCPDCYTVDEFANDHPEGVYVVGTGNHAVAVVDGVVYDSWDSRNEIPVYYWVREGDDV